MQRWLYIAVSTLGLGIHESESTTMVPLVAEGTAQAMVVLAAEPDTRDQLAAEELIEHLELMTGVELPMLSHAPATHKIPVYLGSAADPALDTLSRQAGENPSTFTIRVRADRIDIRGLSPEGTLFGVYELLEQLGFRWYIPGDLGRVIPPGPDALLALQTMTQEPSMKLRLLQPGLGSASRWLGRQRLGGLHRSTGSHGIPPFSGQAGDSVFEEHPDLFAIVDGKRIRRQICVGDPATAALTAQAIREQYSPTTDTFYIGMGPNDGEGYCECDWCVELDGGIHDPFYNTTSKTGRYIAFFNRVLDLLEVDYPNLHIVWYVYANHMMPPPADLQPNPRIVGVFAPITLDRIRSMDNPMSPDRHTLRWLIDAWAATRPNELYYRGYYNNLACVQLPKTQIDRVQNEIPALYACGVNVMRVECIRQSWATDPLTLYVAARLMWNVNLDVEATLSEFYRLFYGPAEQPMRHYHEQLESAFRDTPYFTGSSYLYFPLFLDHPRRADLRQRLDEALRLVEQEAEPDQTTPYVERVRMIRRGYERMDLFLDMIQARNQHDFNTAHALMNAYETLTTEMVDVVLEGEGRWAQRFVSWDERPEFRGSYFNRFFREPVTAGYKRTVSDGNLVAALPDEWLFLLDPSDIGEMAGFQRPGKLGGNWQPMKTSSRSWSDQGLHYYKGVAWYRQKVVLPAEYEGHPVYIWFGGVDRLASVWVNGQFLGTSREPGEGLPGIPGSFRPFDLRATDAVRWGEENWVVVRIENNTLAELGTGGILAPVMFWTPQDPGWTP